MKKQKSIVSIFLTIIAIICLILAGAMLISGFLDDRQSSETLEKLQPSPEPIPEPESNNDNTAANSSQTAGSSDPNSESDSSAGSEPSQSSAPEPESTPGPEPEPLADNPYKESYLANEDMAAWLQIPDTDIDYPVMWTPRDENYYLRRDFDGSKNQNGCLILDTDSCLDPLTTNLIIHGHNMRSGKMFGKLSKYEDQEYFENHRQIILYTEECQRNYEVIAVFRSQVYKKSDQVFKFYKFFQADTQEEFDDFYNNIKELSLYDTGVTAEFGDHFLTLSTCSYHVEQGRFVVVAKEIESGASYLPVQEEGE